MPLEKNFKKKQRYYALEKMCANKKCKDFSDKLQIRFYKKRNKTANASNYIEKLSDCHSALHL
jgi:hypothetical protein